MDTLPSGGRTKPMRSTASTDADNAFESEDASEQTKDSAQQANVDVVVGGRESSADSGTVNDDNQLNQASSPKSAGSALSLSPDENPSDNNSGKYSMDSDGSDQKRTLINKYVKKVKSLMKK